MSRKQVVALVAALLVVLGVYFKVPAPVVDALGKAVAVFADNEGPGTPASGGAASSDAGAPGQ